MSNVLITGCSSGFGRRTALALARRGDRVFATVRRPDARESLEADAADLSLSVHLLDVTDVDAVERTVARIAETDSIDVLVNNAGYALRGPVTRGMARRYAPSAARDAAAYEAEHGETFARYLPRPLMLSMPLLYQGNHNALVPSQTPIVLPPYGKDLDFELELGFVVCRQVRDAMPTECSDAIGGLVLLNDVSLRDTQWEEIHGSPLGPVQKCKSFATVISSEVLTADEALPALEQITGTVEVDQEHWASGRADDFAHTLEECLARACSGETVLAGELLSTGTLAGCSGIEVGRLPAPGATGTLTVPEIGTVSNQFGGTCGLRGCS